MPAKCGNCGGSGRIPNDANPGFKVTAGMGMSICPACGGTGVNQWAQDDTAAPRRGTGGAGREASNPLTEIAIVCFGVLAIVHLVRLDYFGFNPILSVIVAFIAAGILAGVILLHRYGVFILWALVLAMAAPIVQALW